ncbi:MAG: hypothetical protein M1828_001116 [Chrysothrix sp. TS-e1954]|nr:MAG: hypothetical protein M1828_001116 [Chrysothrix sp. TS-e1954]
MSQYWLNDSCSPFAPYASAKGSGLCSLGNAASYAIAVNEASDVMSGIEFARHQNIRLTIKNTGHDYLGRSAGTGSLALWTHWLKDIQFLNFTSSQYTGSAVRLGAGVEGMEATEAAAMNHLRIVSGSCPTIGLVGGWISGGGHGPLMSAYGLGADNVLEYEVVTVDGRHLNVSASNDYSDLYWALSGGGSGNYAVVLSAILKTYADGPVAGASFEFVNTNNHTFWKAVKSWMTFLPSLEQYPGLKTVGTVTKAGFRHEFCDLARRHGSIAHELDALNISLTSNKTSTQPTFLDHLNEFSSTPSTTNGTVASRLVPRLLAQKPSSLDPLVSEIRHLTETRSATFDLIATNFPPSVQNASNAVLPAWRSALFHMNFVISLDEDAEIQELIESNLCISEWQSKFKKLIPHSGSYINEAVFSNPTWKQDYFGPNFERLSGIKQKYDPEGMLWANVAVGSDMREPDAEGRLCRTGSG